MKAPNIIFFDYGCTLIYEKFADDMAGWSAIVSHIVKNPHEVDAEGLQTHFARLYDAFKSRARANLIEPPNAQLYRYLTNYWSLEYDVPFEYLEDMFWDASRPALPMRHAEETLMALRERGVRTAVISNMTYSGDALRRRLDRTLPRAGFEFALASSECGFRKPDGAIFELALRMAGVAPKNAWHCGDETVADAMGAHNAGIYPVWLETDIPRAYLDHSADVEPSAPHLHIRDLAELLDAVDDCV